MKYIIDRLEDGIAVCENELKKLISIPKDKLPEGLREGDVLEEQGGVFSRSDEDTARRRSEMRKKLMDLFE